MNGDENQQPTPGKPDGIWEYTPEDKAIEQSSEVQPDVSRPSQDNDEIAWTASEFIARHKGVGWYLLLIGGTIIIALLLYWYTKDLVTVGAIVAAVTLFGVAAGREPRVLTYQMNKSGLTVGPKFYSYGMFKSFSVIDEGAFSSITLLPLKRFMPPLSVYYDPKDEDAIVRIIARHLPMENRPADAVDRLMKHIRF